MLSIAEQAASRSQEVVGIDTLRMRRILESSRVERLLDAFVSRGSVLPIGAYRIRDPKALTAQMRLILRRAAENRHAWCCWADGLHAWLFTCQLSLPRSAQRGKPVLDVKLYGEEGALQDSGSWMADIEGKWCRCTD
jgi:hypothetical protein